jgi:hypothetical protein
MSVFKPKSPATIPNPVNVWDGTVSSETEVVCCVPAFIEVGDFYLFTVTSGCIDAGEGMVAGSREGRIHEEDEGRRE